MQPSCNQVCVAFPSSAILLDSKRPADYLKLASEEIMMKVVCAALAVDRLPVTRPGNRRRYSRAQERRPADRNDLRFGWKTSDSQDGLCRGYQGAMVGGEGPDLGKAAVRGDARKKDGERERHGGRGGHGGTYRDGGRGAGAAGVGDGRALRRTSSRPTRKACIRGCWRTGRAA